MEPFRATEEEIEACCAEVIAELTKEQRPFVLWLDGTMGAGKTTFVRHLLYRLGLNQNIPVVSPTYTIMNEYDIQGRWYAHIDFYRASDGFSIDELGVLDARTFAGIFIEWPQTPKASETIIPTHTLKIQHDGDDARLYSLCNGSTPSS